MTAIGAQKGSRPETYYRDRLADAVRGDIEWTIRLAGRADVATTRDVFEVEPLHSWRRGLRQVVAYSVFSGKRANLALYGEITGELGVRIYRLLHDCPVDIRLWFFDEGRGWLPITNPVDAARDWSVVTQEEYDAMQMEIVRRVQNRGLVA